MTDMLFKNTNKITDIVEACIESDSGYLMVALFQLHGCLPGSETIDVINSACTHHFTEKSAEVSFTHIGQNSKLLKSDRLLVMLVNVMETVFKSSVFSRFV